MCVVFLLSENSHADEFQLPLYSYIPPSVFSPLLESLAGDAALLAQTTSDANRSGYGTRTRFYQIRKPRPTLPHFDRWRRATMQGSQCTVDGRNDVKLT